MVLRYILRLLRIDVNLPATCRFNMIHQHAVDVRVREIIRNYRNYTSNGTQRIRTQRRLKNSGARGEQHPLLLEGKTAAGAVACARPASSPRLLAGCNLVSRGACAAAAVVDNSTVFDPLNLSGQK